MKSKPNNHGRARGFDAGINLTTVYLATNTRLVLGAENVWAVEAAWRELAAVASR